MEFLDAFSHLYKRVCPSIRPSIGRSVRRLVTHELKSCKSAVLDQDCWRYERERILYRVYGLVSWFFRPPNRPNYINMTFPNLQNHSLMPCCPKMEFLSENGVFVRKWSFCLKMELLSENEVIVQKWSF